jgi:hypothetical protein
MLLTTAAHATTNARQFYDDAATVIPVLLLAVIYQSKSLHPVPGVGLTGLMGIIVIAIVTSALGEFECLHVAAGYNPTHNGQGTVIAAMTILGALAVIDPLFRVAQAWTASPTTSPRATFRKHKGYRAFMIAAGVGIVLTVVGIWLLGASGTPAAPTHKRQQVLTTSIPQP